MGDYAGLTVLGANRFDRAGGGVSNIGDFNGDGFDDFIIGAPQASDGGYYNFYGSAYIVFGGADGPATLSVDALDGTNGFRITPEGASGDGMAPIGDGYYSGSYINSFGSFVAGVGDVNGDGLADVAVAGATNGYSNGYGADPYFSANSIFVIFGRDTAADGAFDAEMSVADLDGTNGFQIFGAGGVLNGIDAAGDVNGDGVDDFLIGQAPTPGGGGYFGGYYTASAALEDGGVTNSNGGYVIFGASDIGASDALDLTQLDGANGFGAIVPRSEFGRGGEGGLYGFSGGSMIALGDVNGDGFGDVGVRTLFQSRTVDSGYDSDGNYYYDVTINTDSRFHVVLGRDADVEGSFEPAIDLTLGASGPEVQELFWRSVSQSYSELTETFNNINVHGVGDINGDGFDDVAVGDPNRTLLNFDGDQGAFGIVSVYFGGPDGFDFDGDRDTDGDGVSDGLNLTGGQDPNDAFPADLIIVKSDDQFNYFGASVADVGDVNGDGIQDIAITAPFVTGVDPAESLAAAGVYLVFGQSSFGAGPVVVDLDDLGQAGYRFVVDADSLYGFGRYSYNLAVSAAGDVNGDGFDDFIIGDPRADIDSLSGGGTDAGRTFVIHGGPDALEAADNADGSNDNTVDLANLGVDIVTGIAPIEVSVANPGLIGVSQQEGASGATIFAFEVRRTGDLSETVSFDFAAQGFGSAGADAADFVGGAFPTGSAVFAAGEATATVEIAVSGDSVIEASELFSFTISNVATDGDSPITITEDQTLARITNDDFPIRFFAQDASVQEGGEGDANVLSFTVVRTGPLFAASVDFNVAGDFFLSAGVDDFAAGEFPRSGTLNFAAGESSKSVSFVVSGDLIEEQSERIRLTLFNAASDEAQVMISDGVAIGTILNDDFPPQIFVGGDIFVSEGNVAASDRELVFTVTRRGDLDGDAVITYDLKPSPAAGDFFAADSDDIEGALPLLGQTITIPDGEASVQVVVKIAEDFVIEPRESLSFSITKIARPDGGPAYEVLDAAQIGTILNDDGRPPVIPPGIEADVFGDPHIVTLDGLGYDFQAVGEYILVETLPGADNPFQVQVRFEPLDGSDLVSVTTRMAVEINGVRVEIDAKGADTLLIGGEPASAEDLALGAIDVDGDGIPDVFIDSDTGMFFLVLNGADEQLAVKAMNGALNVCVFLADGEGGNAGNVRGLMGDGGGDGTSDDLALRDGTVLTQPVDFDVIYGDYAASWRLMGPEQDIFFSNEVDFPANFPAAQLTLDDLPADLRAMAEAAAIAAGLDPEDTVIFEAAVLDFALTGDASFFAGALGLAADPMASTTPANAPVLPTVVGVTDAEPGVALIEGDSGVSEAIFTFYRLGDASEEITISYQIDGGVDAADLAAGTLFTGTVVLEAGATSASIAVGVLGDLATEADEALRIRITGTGDPDALIGAPSVTKTILTDDFAPVAADDLFSGDEDTRIEGNLRAANPTEPDSDADGDDITVTQVIAASGATRDANGGLFILPSGAHLRVNADGSFSYDPFGFGAGGGSEDDTIFDRLDDGEIAVESFSYVISDGNGGLDTGSVSITVIGVNDAPSAVIDALALTEDDVSASVNVIDGPIAPDLDPEGGPLTVTQISVGGQMVAVDPSTGARIDLANGAFLTITAAGDARFFTNGAFQELGDQPGQLVQNTVNFTYTIADENGLTDSALLQVFVAGVNDAPEIGALSANFAEGAEGSLNLLEGATDAEGDDLAATGVALSASDGREVAFDFNAETGFLTLGAGQFLDLDGGESLTLTVNYDVTDGALDTTNTATITINGVDSANTPPVAADDSFSTGFGETLAVDAANGLLANDSDADGDTLSVVAFDPALNGQLQVFADGSFLYTPNEGTSGEEVISYTVSDGLDITIATLTISVDPNTPPVAADDSFSTDFGAVLNVHAANGLLANDSDADGDTLSVIAFDPAANGRLQVFADGSFLYSPNEGANGDEVISYTVSDGFDFATATLTISVGEEPGEMPLILGTAGGDLLRGTAAAEILDGLGGRDFYLGGGGGDVLRLGNLEADQFRGFDAALDKLDVSAWGVQSFDELSIFDRGDLITIADRASANASYTLGEGQISAADFTADNFIFAAVQDLALNGVKASGAEFLTGRAGNDVIEGGAGYNVMTGLGGEDIFVIGLGGGDVVTDFSSGEDLLDIRAWGADEFADLRISESATQIFVRDSAAHLLRLEKAGGLEVADLNEDSFQFTDILVS